MTFPAIGGAVSFFMATETPTHDQALGLPDPRHIGNITMAFLALNASPDMPLVRKINVIREVVDLDPRDRFLTVPIALNLLYFRTIRAYGRVTAQAPLDARDPRHFGLSSVNMTKGAKDRIVAGMYLVTEINRLFRGGIDDDVFGQRLPAGKKHKNRDR